MPTTPLPVLAGGNTASNPASSFDPTTVPGLVVWAKADAIVGKIANDAISQWDDSSGNANHLVQATSNLQPTYQTGGANGLPFVRFSGTTNPDFLEASPGAKSQPNTLFAVYRVAATGGNPCLIASNNGTNRNQIFLNNAHWTYYAGTVQEAATGPSAATWYVVEAVFNGASTEMWVNGTSVKTGDPGTGTEATFRVGADSAGASAATNQDIPETLSYNAAVSALDRSSVRAMLGSKYAITVV